MKTIAVIGAGNGGHSASYELTRKGYAVHLYDVNADIIHGIRERGGIRATGKAEGFAPIPVLTTVLEEALEGAEAVLVMVPRFAHGILATQLTTCIKEGQRILLCPGSTFGELEMASILWKGGRRFTVSSFATLPYAARLKAPGEIFISLLVHTLLFGSFPARDTDAEAAYFHELFPGIQKVKSCLEIGLNNGNPVTHPAPILLNAARVERGEDFLFYREGVSPTVARINEKVDRERLALCRGLGFREIPVTERLFLTGYADRIYSSVFEAYQASEAFAPIVAPKSLKDRYVLEDIPYGLVSWASLGALLQTPTPTMDLLIRLGSEIVGVDFYQEGTTLKRFGLGELGVNEILRFVQEGRSPQVEWSV
ncbi:MAG: NAD/NADP octopine/nopaline dehydrogenase family protein [Thermodesulfobacteriota bacterium]